MTTTIILEVLHGRVFDGSSQILGYAEIGETTIFDDPILRQTYPITIPELCDLYRERFPSRNTFSIVERTIEVWYYVLSMTLKGSLKLKPDCNTVTILRSGENKNG